MSSLLAAIFVFGILIFVHELGHFIMAKLRHVRVEKFSLGFGPELITHKIRDTKYILSLIPLGGYVKMAGDSLEDEKKGEPYEYLSKSVGERMSIILSGPLMNIALCVAILTVLFSSGLPYLPARIGAVLDDSPAENAGLAPGDIIEEIDGRQAGEWEELTKIIHRNPGKLLKLKVKREEDEIELVVTPGLDETKKIGLIGITPYYGRRLGKVLKNSSAYKAGLRDGDEITRVAGASVSQWNEVMDIIEEEKDDNVSLSILRYDEKEARQHEFEVNLNFKRDEKGLPLLDFYPSLPEKRFPFFVSLSRASTRTFYLIKVMYAGLWQLFSGQVSMKSLGGPILIAQLAGQEAEMGIGNLFLFVAIISVNLAVLNLLPIPVLDGGHILFLGIEKITGKPLSKRKQEIVQQIGIVIILTLVIVATYNDVLRFFSR